MTTKITREDIVRMGKALMEHPDVKSVNITIEFKDGGDIHMYDRKPSGEVHE